MLSRALNWQTQQEVHATQNKIDWDVGPDHCSRLTAGFEEIFHGKQGDP